MIGLFLNRTCNSDLQVQRACLLTTAFSLPAMLNQRSHSIYNRRNTVATRLNNAQPWRLLFAYIFGHRRESQKTGWEQGVFISNSYPRVRRKLPLIRYAGSAGRSLGKSTADGQLIQSNSLVFEPNFASHWVRNSAIAEVAE